MKDTAAVYQNINVYQFKVPMHVHIHRYVHLKSIVCKDAVGQTQEKRHLGRESSGALICMGKLNRTQNGGIQNNALLCLHDTQVME